MATGPEHYKEAETILFGDSCEYGCPHSGCEHEMRLLARAQAHATLALAAAHAMGIGDLPSPDWDAWREVAQTRDEKGRIVD